MCSSLWVLVCLRITPWTTKKRFHGENKEKINWNGLCENPSAIEYLEQHKDDTRINWTRLSRNPNIFTWDYELMRENMKESGLAKELAAKVFHPDRLAKICEEYGVELEELLDMY